MIEKPSIHGMRQIHGLSGVTKAAMRDDKEVGQDVKITDDGSFVSLSLSTSSFPAKLTPAQADYLANRLKEAARRARGQGSGK